MDLSIRVLKPEEKVDKMGSNEEVYLKGTVVIKRTKSEKRMWKTVKDTFKTNHMFMVTFVLFVIVNISVFVLAAIFPNWEKMYKDTPEFFALIQQNVCHPLGTCAPTVEHPLGTTYLSYDNLICLINAAKNSLIIGYGAAAISVPIAVFVGIIGGYKGGTLDNFFSMITNVVLVLPIISIYMFIAANVGAQDTPIVILLIGLLTWPWAA